MKRSSSSGLDKSVHFEEVLVIASNLGDVRMLVRSMGSDWIRKPGRLLSQTETGLGDSGAHISVTNVATAATFGLQRHQYDIPIQPDLVCARCRSDGHGIRVDGFCSWQSTSFGG